jgi:hypothetical protein
MNGGEDEALQSSHSRDTFVRDSHIAGVSDAVGRVPFMA